jgi:hypothetical protein
MANSSPIAGLNPPGSTGTSPNVFQNTLTPGYTGGFGAQSVIPGFDWSKVDPNTIAPYALFTGFAQGQRQEERAAERELFNEVQAMRKREAQEAYQMQLPFKIGGMVGDIFQNIVQAQQPGLQAELAIRSRTGDLLNQAYNNPISQRKWLS